MTFEQQTPDRPSGQAVILHFTVFCVLLPLLQRFRGMGGIPGKLAFQFFQRGEFAAFYLLWQWLYLPFRLVWTKCSASM